MENKLNEIDDILASFEDIMHGTNGEDCTKARKLLIEVHTQLKLYNLQIVSNRRELLIAFYSDLKEQVGTYRIKSIETEKAVDVFLKSNL